VSAAGFKILTTTAPCQAESRSSPPSRHDQLLTRTTLGDFGRVDVAPIRRFVDDETDDGEVGFLASRVTGRLRLVAGMVRANRRGRALLGLSKLLVGAFGTAAFSLATNSIW